jgi:hypothetical protein
LAAQPAQVVHRAQDFRQSHELVEGRVSVTILRAGGAGESGDKRRSA